MEKSTNNPTNPILCLLPLVVSVFVLMAGDLVVPSGILTVGVLGLLYYQFLYDKRKKPKSLKEVKQGNETLISELKGKLPFNGKKTLHLAVAFPACIADVYKDLDFFFANKQYHQWFTDRHQYSNREAHSLHEFSYIASELILEQVKQYHKTVTIEKEFELANGNKCFGKTSIIPVMDSNNCFKAYLFYIEDITNLKEKELIMANMNMELELEAEKQQRMEERLMETNYELQRFASAASHDMKEPLRTICSFSGLLAKRVSGDSTSQELLSFIQSAGKRMTQLLDDLINYARAGLDELEEEEVNLNKVVLTVQKNLYTKIQSTNAIVSVNNLPNLIAHSTPITQLLQNIVANSIKFQQSDERPIINISSYQNESEIMLSIEDNGVGMSQENMDRIFEPFQRLHTQAQFEGSGIGLATCKKIVKKYNGEIWATSELGIGTTFHISFPIDMLKKEEAMDALPASA